MDQIVILEESSATLFSLSMTTNNEREPHILYASVAEDGNSLNLFKFFLNFYKILFEPKLMAVPGSKISNVSESDSFALNFHLSQWKSHF